MGGLGLDGEHSEVHPRRRARPRQRHRGGDKHATWGTLWVRPGQASVGGLLRMRLEWEVGVRRGVRDAPHFLGISPLLWLTSSESQPWRGRRCSFWKGWSSSAGGHSPSVAAGRAQELEERDHGSSEHEAGGQPPEVCGRVWAGAHWS